MATCVQCDQVTRAVLSGAALVWRCEYCGREEPGKPAETLLAFENTDSANTGDPARHAAMLRQAAHDPVNLKVERACPTCKKRTRMSRVFLGDAETAKDVCEECNEYFSPPRAV